MDSDNKSTVKNYTGKSKESGKIKDFVRIGIFSALWVAVSFAIACTIGFIPVILIVMPCILAIVGTIILEVMISKVTVPGGIAIASLLLGLCLFTMAPYGLMFIFTFAGGMLGEIIYQTIGKKSNAGKIIGLAAPMLGLALGEYIPICYMSQTYLDFYESRGTLGVAQSIINIINTPLLIVLSAVTIGCSVLGYLWGKKIISKRLQSGK